MSGSVVNKSAQQNLRACRRMPGSLMSRFVNIFKEVCQQVDNGARVTTEKKQCAEISFNRDQVTENNTLKRRENFVTERSSYYIFVDLKHVSQTPIFTGLRRITLASIKTCFTYIFLICNGR